RLRHPHAGLLQFLERFGVRGLELDDMPSARSLREAHSRSIHRAGEVPAVRAHAPLLAVCVPILYLHSDRTQVGDEALFLALPGVQQPQDAAGHLLGAGPPEREPEPAITGLADLACAQMRPGAVVALPLVGG